MNLSAIMPSLQVTVSWTLLGVLLAWMFFFAFLAFRPQKARKREAAELPTPSGVFPAIAARPPLHRASAPVDMPFSGTSGVASESAGDIGSTPVA